MLEEIASELKPPTWVTPRRCYQNHTPSPPLNQHSPQPVFCSRTVIAWLGSESPPGLISLARLLPAPVSPHPQREMANVLITPKPKNVNCKQMRAVFIINQFYDLLVAMISALYTGDPAQSVAGLQLAASAASEPSMMWPINCNICTERNVTLAKWANLSPQDCQINYF